MVKSVKSANKNVELVINKDRFSVFMDYDYETVKIFQKIEKRFWDMEFSTWYLPLTDFSSVYEYLTGRGFKVTQCNQDVILWRTPTTLTFKLSKWMDNRSELLKITDVDYNENSKYYTYPIEAIDAIKQVFAANNMTVLERIKK